MRLRYLFSICLLFPLLSLYAQPGNSTEIEAIEIGKTYQIHSDILEEDRPLNIYLPKGYEESTKSYPVIYLLDGDRNFHHTTASVSFLSREGRIPEMIVVGIPNTGQRTRDLTPPTTARKDEFPTAGGAELALPFAERATKLYPKSEKSWHQLGEYQKNAGQDKAAIASFQKALEIDPTSLPTKVALKELGVDVGDDVPTYEVTDKQLRAYTGAYDLSIGLTFNLELEDGKLWILAPETAKESIVPLEEDVFFVSSKNARLTFDREGGKVTGMTIVTPGPTFTGKKVK